LDNEYYAIKKYATTLSSFLSWASGNRLYDSDSQQSPENFAFLANMAYLCDRQMTREQ
jgi:hypothetical protein